MAGNERFRRLAEIIDRGDYKFPFEVRDPLGVRGVADIRKKILEEREEGRTDTVDLIGKLFYEPEVQQLLSLNNAKISDISRYLGLEDGKVWGLELREMGPTNSHKDLMIASLILARLMTRGLPKEEMDTITDAGFFNSALATRFYSEHFGLRGAYFIQETTPKRLIDRLEAPHFEVNLVSNKGTSHDQKNATYKALLKRFHQDQDFKRRTYHLGHAELGNFVTSPIGKRFAQLFREREIKPDIFISPIGAATTIMGLGEPLQDELGLELAVGEYAEFTPVLEKLGLRGERITEYPESITSKEKEKVTDRNNRIRGVISRQIELNPFVPEDFWARISHAYQLDPSIDTALLYHLHNEGYDVGITTAGTMAMAAKVAREGKTVVVPIFEKFRDYHPNGNNSS